MIFFLQKNKKSEPTVIYELPVRIVRFKISDDSYEVIATNLSEDLFSSNDLKMLYSMHWGIETSFRDLKYTVGLRYFHAKKDREHPSGNLCSVDHVQFFLNLPFPILPFSPMIESGLTGSISPMLYMFAVISF